MDADHDGRALQSVVESRLPTSGLERQASQGGAGCSDEKAAHGRLERGNEEEGPLFRWLSALRALDANRSSVHDDSKLTIDARRFRRRPAAPSPNPIRYCAREGIGRGDQHGTQNNSGGGMIVSGMVASSTAITIA